MGFVLLLAPLLALLLALKVRTGDDVNVPAKPVVVAGVAPNGDLLSANIVLSLVVASKGVRRVIFCGV